INAADDAENLALVNQQLGTPNWFNGASVQSAAAAFRATVPDHLPTVGEIAPGLYVFGAMGARGITLAPLLSEVLVASLCAEPIPLSLSLLHRVSGQRFQPVSATNNAVTE